MVKYLKHITLITLLLTAACSDGDDIPVYCGDIMLSSGIEGSLSWQSSRDGETPIPGILPETMGVFAERRLDDNLIKSEYEVFNDQCMYNPNGTAVLDVPEIVLSDWPTGVWPYTPVKKWEEVTYNFYCYAPYNPDKAEWLPGPNYYTFHLYNIPPISATEYTVGKYMTQVKSGTRPELTLTHITSRLRFLFAIGEQFDKLRTIRVTSIKISDSGSGSPYWECEVALDRSDPNELVINVTKSANIYTSTDDIELIAENESDDPAKPGQRLATTYKSFTSAYNLLGKIDFTNLTVVYDVYDKADMLLRKDQTVTNKINLRSFGDLERGKCYDVKIMVSPKYLYVLSDNDIAPDLLLEPLPETP